MIVFLTGASGVGKTSLVEKLEQDYSNSDYEFHHFDSIGVPSREEMKTVENWQRETTHKWIGKLVARKGKDIAILEGSSNIKYILSGFEKYGYTDYLVILIDCDEDTMIKRLIETRNQPELANEDMKNWLKYLRNQAVQLSVEIIDTSKSDIDSCIESLLNAIGRARKEKKRS